jgi:hypothetical protein
MGAPLREATDLVDQRSAKVRVLAPAALDDVAGAGFARHIGIPGAEVTLDLVGDGR